jgi:zinc transport system substrate-binding protein
MRPSDAEALQNAKVIIWVGGRLEKFLQKPLEAIANKAQILELSKAKGVVFHSLRKGGAWEKHGHGNHAHGKHGHGKGHHGKGHDGETHHDEHETDSHIWLDPHNARAFVGAIVEVLSKADPANASLFKKNGAETIARLEKLEKALNDQLKPVRGREFIVFHDSFQYFEKRFSLTGVGSISLGDARAPGARRLREMRKKVSNAKAICVFSEPQFQPRLVQTIIEGTKARTGVLDPLGAAIANGPGLYFTMMRNNAKSMEKCLRR